MTMQLTIAPEVAAAHEARIQALQRAYGALFEAPTRLNSKPIIVNGRRFANASEAAPHFNIAEQALRDACNGRRNLERKGIFARWE